MPSLEMKSNLNNGCLREKGCLQVCKKSTVISKSSYPCVNVASDIALLHNGTRNCWNENEVSSYIIEYNESMLFQNLPKAEDIQLPKQGWCFVDQTTSESTVNEFMPAINVDTIFSPILETIEIQNGLPVYGDEGNNRNPVVQNLRAKSMNEIDDQNGKADGIDETSRNKNDNETGDVSDYYISNVSVDDLPFAGDMETRALQSNNFTDYRYSESSLFFSMADCYMLSFYGNTFETSNIEDYKSFEESASELYKSGFYQPLEHLKVDAQDSDWVPDSSCDQEECFDTNTMIKDLPDLSDTGLCEPSLAEREMSKKKAVTLVLDLDETLVHSTLENCEEADFSFRAFFNLKEHIVYVKQRPFLREFLETVAKMFEIVVFTASQSIYAEQLLDILDPDGKIISRRFYRESCVFSDGSYTKDLTILGVDLAKVAIIDNSPQVYQLQVDNGIPIKSWFDDLSDGALISLLPFLETLVDVDDVRPLIAKRFGNKESEHRWWSTKGEFGGNVEFVVVSLLSVAVVVIPGGPIRNTD